MKLESLKNAKFQQLTKEEASKIQGGHKEVTYSNCHYVWLTDGSGTFSVTGCDQTTTTSFLGITISSNTVYVQGTTQTDGPH
jgi:hypothetical protein